MNQDNDPLAGAIEPAEPARVLLHMPVDVRSVSLGLLATLASVFVLRWASAVFIPVMVGVLFSYALSPLVDWLQLRRIPRAFERRIADTWYIEQRRRNRVFAERGREQAGRAAAGSRAKTA